MNTDTTYDAWESVPMSEGFTHDKCNKQIDDLIEAIAENNVLLQHQREVNAKLEAEIQKLKADIYDLRYEAFGEGK
jgi:hypothetical protein